MSTTTQPGTERDDAVLDFIFNPQADRPIAQKSVTLPPLQPRPEMLTDEVVAELQLLEREAIRLAETGKLDGGYEVLTRVIARAPMYAPAYNNRAQVLRLMHKVDLAVLDLDKAVALAYDSLTLRQSLTQRGLLHKLREEDAKAFADLNLAGQMGSEVARQEAVTVNPNAKLCSNMVAQVMKAQYEQPM